MSTASDLSHFLRICADDMDNLELPPDIDLAVRRLNEVADKLDRLATLPSTVTLKERIDELIQVHRTMRAVSRATGVDIGYLSRLRSGKKQSPGPDTLKRLSLRSVVTYEKLPLRSIP